MTESPDDELASRLDEALRESQLQEREDARRALERQEQTDRKLADALTQEQQQDPQQRGRN